MNKHVLLVILVIFKEVLVKKNKKSFPINDRNFNQLVKLLSKENLFEFTDKNNSNSNSTDSISSMKKEEKKKVKHKNMLSKINKDSQSNSSNKSNHRTSQIPRRMKKPMYRKHFNQYKKHPAENLNNPEPNMDQGTGINQETNMNQGSNMYNNGNYQNMMMNHQIN